MASLDTCHSTRYILFNLVWSWVVIKLPEKVAKLILVTFVLSYTIWLDPGDLVIFTSLAFEKHWHTGKCIRRFAGINVYCWYFIEPMW